MSLIVLLMRWWHGVQRRIDLQVLWPACKREAGGNLELAKAAFAVHAFHDEAWLVLGEKRLFQAIDELK